ncbi:heavy-metal-associated domain-containing protein [Rhodococcus sp. SGAir0479]|uniref:heavy-metal-associated domain-containing protein n=1 Tax=Rhodococcus sp. SGAir0479 TaxID=2567884 RepID=UPI0010CD4983|nr:heavy metal-associated domain-containing protein [Rhodococcus sp. SGAir0479]QCQ91188.1 heavy-metal-associated domain-containing protein [Rhodococcus sp. SGAir0479]
MSSTSTYRVIGMTCGGCAGKVTSRVEQIPDITDVDVDLATSSITVTWAENVSDDAVRNAVEQAGYRIAAN